MRGQFTLSDLAIFSLALGQVAHNLRQLHFPELVQFFRLDHPRLDLADGLGVNLDLLVGDLLDLYAVGAQLLFGSLLPGVDLEVVLGAHRIWLEERFFTVINFFVFVSGRLF